MRQLDKLLEIAAQENKLTKHELFIKGQDLTFWSKPLTISEYQLAKKQSKNPEDVLESTARLFIKKACDARRAAVSDRCAAGDHGRIEHGDRLQDPGRDEQQRRGGSHRAGLQKPSSSN